MLNVLTPEEVLELINSEFSPQTNNSEFVSVSEAFGRVLSEPVSTNEYIPDFNRSTVDGYAVHASDTFGCSDSIPAILELDGEVLMGESAGAELLPGYCRYVPTGAAVPEGADCVVMLEYAEAFGDGSIGISKAGAPGLNMIYRGDDVFPGKVILNAGRTLSGYDIGALAAAGICMVPVVKKPLVGIISTGDELVSPDTVPGPGQVRDVNSLMLSSVITAYGAECLNYGIVADDEFPLKSAVEKAASECDVILLSGGSSVGVKDAACRIIGSLGSLLFHGIAIKPGKPTMLGKIASKPIAGLPGHPVAAYFVCRLFVLPLIGRLMGRESKEYTIDAVLSENVSANHGRAQYNCCRLEKNGDILIAHPVRTKSGLITNLAGADGFFCISRDCEGLPAGAHIKVTLCER